MDDGRLVYVQPTYSCVGWLCYDGRERALEGTYTLRGLRLNLSEPDSPDDRPREKERKENSENQHVYPKRRASLSVENEVFSILHT